MNWKLRLNGSLVMAFLLASGIYGSPTATNTSAIAAPVATKAPDSKKLKRADFRVTGASCVSCLRRVGKTMREQKGVLKADVSIFKPYWALVIYDGALTSVEKIYEAVKSEKVRFEDIEDKTISEVPLIPIPKGLNRASK